MKIAKFLALVLAAVSFIACQQNNLPKPRAYYRIDFPEKEYHDLDLDYPFNFKLLTTCKPKASKGADDGDAWLNIYYPKYKGTIHLSYKKINANLDEYLEDAHKLVYKHAIMADAIETQIFENKENKVFGILYQIEGNAASSVQFIATDSTTNFIRGALYFNTHTNADSLKPVIQFINKDIIKIMETLEWK